MAGTGTLSGFANVRPSFDAQRRRRASAWPAIGALLACIGCNGPILTPPPPPVAVWAVGADRNVARDATPLPENEVYSSATRTISLTAAINETVAAQLVARADAPPGAPAYSIHFSDLVGTSGSLAAPETIRLYHLHYARIESFRSWYPQHAERAATPVLVGDILVPWVAPRGGGPLRLTVGANEVVWIDVRVPPTTAPGEYQGGVELRSTQDQKIAWSGTLALRVLPVALPSDRELPVICRVDPRDLLADAFRWPHERPEDTRILVDAAAHRGAVELIDSAMTVLHEHHTNPVLWASFPKFRETSSRAVEVAWEPYDALIERWLDGSAFADRAALGDWVYPISFDYPDIERNGGAASAQYARLLAGYYAACRQHFAERGWQARLYVRPAPPGDISQEAADTMRRVAGILQQADGNAPLISHLPPQSPRALGWYNAPAIEAPKLGLTAPPAMLFDPAAMRNTQAVGRPAWFVPDEPPYSPSLRIEAPSSDARALPWQAYRYGADGVWIEHAADGYRFAVAVDDTALAGGQALLYPGSAYGLPNQVFPSVRLKRLRAGLADFALLRLMERGGKQLLAQTISQRLVRYAFTDACADNLLTVHEAGWPTDPAVYSLAHELMLQELVNEFEPSDTGRAQQLANLAGWGRVLQQASLLTPHCGGVRLAVDGAAMRASVFVNATNRTDRPVAGRWSIAKPPLGAEAPRELEMTLAPGTRRNDALSMMMTGLAFNAEGVYSFGATFDSPALGAFAVPCRLAVATAPFTTDPPTIDGDLDDWAMTLSNCAGDFRLVRGENPTPHGGDADRPTLPTQAWFCADDRNLYVAVRCSLPPGEQPLWRGDNTVPLDGAIPWGQDVVEILLAPTNIARGASSDIDCLQIKPSGLLIARHGCLTQPPIGASEDWNARALVATHIASDSWTVELSLPLGSLGKPALQHRIWGVNITRLDAARGEYSSWSAARGHCYSPQALGNLIVQRP